MGPQPQDCGRVIWRYRSNRTAGRLVNAGMALLVLAVIWFFLLPVMRSDAVMAAKLLVFAFVLAGIGGLYGSVRLLTRPVTLLSVHEAGLRFHRGRRGYEPRGYFVPWERILAIETGQRERLDDRGTAVIPTIAVTVTRDGPPLPEHLLGAADNGSAVLHLDLLFGGRGGDELMRRLNRYRAAAS